MKPFQNFIAHTLEFFLGICMSRNFLSEIDVIRVKSKRDKIIVKERDWKFEDEIVTSFMILF